jgi:outer membrane protein assembly factor BamB
VSLLILIWWIAFSRARAWERVVGLLGVVILAVAAIYGMHASMQGMGVMLFLIPWGVTAFGLALVLLARQGSLRVPVALVAAALGFGYWDLIQSHGVTGAFQPELAWRWEASPEQQYVASRKSRTSATPDSLAADPGGGSQVIWPVFRGPKQDNHCYGIALDGDWSKNPPKRIWENRIGPGWSSFTVAGNRLYTQDQREDREGILCLDANTGNVVWEYDYPSRFWEAIAGAGPRATPTLAQEGLFALGADGILTCLDSHSGQKKWERDLKVDAGRKPPEWGFASSPLVIQGLVLVHAGGKAYKGVLAYDAKSGEPQWSVASGDHSYSSLHRASFHGVDGVLMMTNDGMQFLDSLTGNTLWKYDAPGQNYRALQPLLFEDSVLMATSLGGGVHRLTPTRQDDAWTVKLDWHSTKMKPDFNDYVAYQGHLYGFDRDIFACVELADGTQKWKRGRYGNGQVLLLADAGQLLVISEKGELVLLKADPKEHIELARLQVQEGKTWNHPVLIGNRLYVRNGQSIGCWELPQAVGPSL